MPDSEQAGTASEVGVPVRDLLLGGPDLLAVSAIPRVQKGMTGRPVEDVSESSGVTLGRVIESTIPSDLLGLDLPFRVYLPPGYEKGSRRYPVLYLLHGNGGGLQTEWTEELRIGVVADALIAGELIQPMLIVMPDGEHSYFMNHYGSGQRWQDYIVDEVVPFVDEHFRTIPDRNSRGIAGHSMGGVGALAIAFTRPDLFGSVGAHSPSLRLTAEGGPEYFGPPDYFARFNPLDLASTAEGIELLKISVDFGEDDYWLEDGSYLLSALERRSITPEWRVSPGDHWASYWINNEPDYLRFHSDAFAPPALP
jgi:enterochelin esterase-like enzyme